MMNRTFSSRSFVTFAVRGYSTANGTATPLMPRPNKIGLLAMEQYFPSTYVDQSALEKYDGVADGKYVKGLEQQKMAFCGDREDIYSMFLTATSSLLRKYNLNPRDIGRLEVGTETLIDKSKSIKTVLMDLFEESGNHDVEGVDNINACYGGTAALFNTVNWVDSSSWDGRYGLVVCGDIAVYEPGPARPTGGVGITAMLVGPNAPIVIEPFRGSYMENAWDFYKPNLESEYPVVDGHLSISCYYRALDSCYSIFKRRFQAAHGRQFDIETDSNHALFHSPFTKLVRKSFARLYQNEWREGRDFGGEFKDVDQVGRTQTVEETYTNAALQKQFCNLTDARYQERVSPSLLLPLNLGNSYTGSLYASIMSLIAERSDSELKDTRALMFSYGSGLAATMYSLKFSGDVSHIRKAADIKNRLAARTSVSAEEYSETMALREATHSLKDYTPSQPIDNLFPGTFYLDRIDSNKVRTYNSTPLEQEQAQRVSSSAEKAVHASM